MCGGSSARAKLATKRARDLSDGWRDNGASSAKDAPQHGPCSSTLLRTRHALSSIPLGIAKASDAAARSPEGRTLRSTTDDASPKLGYPAKRGRSLSDSLSAPQRFAASNPR